MATSIVQDLTKAGYRAQYLPPETMHPVAGLWVHGVFTELNEGSRLQRAVIGFGAGEAKMELYVTMSDAAKFVLEKNAPERTIKQTASEVSARAAQYLTGATPAAAAKSRPKI